MPANDVNVGADALELDQAVGGRRQLRVARVLPRDLDVDESHAAELRRFVFQTKRRGKPVLDVRLQSPLPTLQPLDELAQTRRKRRLLRVQIPFVVSLVLRHEVGVFRGRIRAETRAANAGELLLETRGNLRSRRRRVLVTPVQQSVHDHQQPLLGRRREPRAELAEQHLELGDEVRVLVTEPFHHLLGTLERNRGFARGLRRRLRRRLIRLGLGHEFHRRLGGRVIALRLLRGGAALLRLGGELPGRLRHPRRRLSALEQKRAKGAVHSLRVPLRQA